MDLLFHAVSSDTFHVTFVTTAPHFSVFFLLEAAWVKSRAERPSVSEVSGQLHVQFGCKLSSKLAKKRIKQDSKQITNYKFQIRRMQ